MPQRGDRAIQQGPVQPEGKVLKASPSGGLHRFQQLPDELKVMIWKEALPRDNIQYISIDLDEEKNSDPRQQSQTLTTMTATLAELKKSTWWHRHNISRVNRLANGVVKSLPRRSLLCRSAAFPKKGKAGGIIQAVDIGLASEVVCIHFTGPNPMGIFEGLLVQHTIMRPLQKLRRLAIDLDNLSGRGLNKKQRDWFDNPLVCICNQGWQHTTKAFCPRVLRYWLLDLRGLQTFYVMCRLAQLKDLDKEYVKVLKEAGGSEVPLPAQNNARSKSGNSKRAPMRRKPNAREMLLGVMKRFKETAKRERLEVYEDAQTAYYEVREQDSEPLAIHRDIWPLLRETWMEGEPDEVKHFRRVSYKLLVGCGLKTRA
ncbi:uncharacterized protein B0I36DRAFT_384763 [Microdochium trichocladiopsis]|uniref:2EXR domain-containing protein n=1 Tax=Microdochium trichocladiopsis TaxID=1682393 RepID=A0A9P9BM34_9PEZI|nr:uncharacterized protein B0I36DRAFT_384763 [Microdochium trichocladiopsis]KAH7029213.1 hypothetical protein B0I36DRAFT_384763 [Microdochium trichocladiopsis]